MSTRCLIKFENNVCIYRHSDGYPSGVLIDLKNALKNGVRNYDTEYFIGGFLQQMGAKHQKWLDDYYNEDKGYDPSPEMRNSVLGYGIFYTESLEDEDRWQEYCYLFNKNEVKILTSDAKRCVRKFKYDELMSMSNEEIIEKVKRY